MNATTHEHTATTQSTLEARKALEESVVKYVSGYIEVWNSPMPFSAITRSYNTKIKKYEDSMETFLDSISDLRIVTTARGARAVFTLKYYNAVAASDGNDGIHAVLSDFDISGLNKARTK
jgi:hypothetical protein